MAADTAGEIRGDKAFIGHPAGLGWLAFTEFWERFSYYGMSTLLVLYLTGWLFQGDHVQHVLGFGPFHAFVDFLYGPRTTPAALATAITGLYAGLVYLTPLAGGYLADRFLGRTMAVTIGASLMALGHFLMAFDATFLIAITCLVTGVGFFKGNIASQVGGLYKTDDPRRGDAYQVFLMAVQIAVIISPLICGTLGEKVGWHYGFGAAGVGMLIGLLTYLGGRRWLPPEPPRIKRGETSEARPPLSRTDWIKVGVLLALLPVLAVAIVGNQQINIGYVLWAKANYQLVFFGETMPVTWLQSLDAFISAITMAASVAFWRWWTVRWTEPDEITKITIGVGISALAPLTLAAASALVASHGAKVGLIWGVAFHVLNDIGFANVLPIGLALYSRAAPKGYASVIIGCYYLHLFMGNPFAGWIAGFLGTMSATSFWLLHVWLMMGAGAILIVVRTFAGRILAPAYQHTEAAT